MSPWHLQRLLKKDQHQVHLIDVRTPFEFNWFHIRGADHKPELLAGTQALPQTDKDKPVVVICMTGHRSPLVAYRLKKRGFKRVYNLTWGMLAWKLSGMSNDE
jgi:rhodanese-related sulfurtransferase